MIVDRYAGKRCMCVEEIGRLQKDSLSLAGLF